MKRLLKLAVIGGGLNSTIGQTHIKSINSTGKYKIYCGFFSRKKIINDKSAVEYKIPKEKVYKSLTNLIEKEKNNIDAALVLTPPDTRYEIFKKLAENRIDIISEKPFESSFNRARKIYKIIRSSKINFLSTYNYLGYPGIMEMRPLIKRKIGKILNFVFEMPQQSITYDSSVMKKWRLKDKNIPNLYLDLASHLLSLTYYLFDEHPKQINNFASNRNKFKVIDNSFVWLKFKKFSGNFWFSKNSTGQRNQLSLRIFGNKGSVKWEHAKPEQIVFFDNKGKIEIINRLSKRSKFINNNKFYTYSAGHPNGFLDAFGNIYTAISKVIMEKTGKNTVPLILNLKQNYNIMSIMNTMHKASKKGGWNKVRTI